MASGMKYWLGAVLVGLTLVSIWQLPPQGVPLNQRPVTRAEELVFTELRREVLVTRETLRRHLWSDSLTSLVFDTETDGVAITYIDGYELNADQVTRFEEKVRGEVEEARAGNPDVVFGYVFQSRRQNSTTSRAGARDGLETFTGSLDGTPYCLQVLVLDGRSMRRALATELAGRRDAVSPITNLVGACRPYLRYGEAGDRIQGWMERGGARHALEYQTEPGFPQTPRLRAPLSSSFVGITSRPIEADQCLAGDTDACGWLMARPGVGNRIDPDDLTIVAASPATSLDGGRRGASRWTFGSRGSYLLSDLEADMGAEAFAEFWTSDEEFSAAFEDAFDTDAGSWLLGWLSRSVGIYPPGPGLPRSATSGSVLTILLLLGLAWSVQRRRRVV
jgi:hypothetical protein